MCLEQARAQPAGSEQESGGRDEVIAARADRSHSVHSPRVMERFRNPRNVGVVENADGVGKVGNPVWGDIMARV